MQKRYVLALGVLAAVGLLSAQRGPACPYQDAERSAAAQTVVSSDVTEGTPAEGSVFAFGRSAIFAP